MTRKPLQARTCSCIATEFFKSSITKDSSVQLRGTQTDKETDSELDSNNNLHKLLTKPWLWRAHPTWNVIEWGCCVPFVLREQILVSITLRAAYTTTLQLQEGRLHSLQARHCIKRCFLAACKKKKRTVRLTVIAQTMQRYCTAGTARRRRWGLWRGLIMTNGVRSRYIRLIKQILI